MLAWVAVSLAVLLVLVTVGGYAVYRHLNGNIHTKDVFAGLDHRPAPGGGRAENYLLVGSDTRAAPGDQAFQGTGVSQVTGARSDTTILAHLSANRDKAVLVSIPRDSYVQIPACRRADGSTSKPQKAKFNAAFAFGGATCTIKTVEQLTGLHVDHYVEVDFSGFQRMVAALGGVPVCLSEPINDPAVPAHGDTPGHGTGLVLSAGRHVLDGPTALAFVRERYGSGGDDLTRIRHQQEFLAAVVRKATSTGLLLQPLKLYRFADAATKSITTDPGLNDINALRHLAKSLQGLDPGKVTFLTVPLTGPDRVRIPGYPNLQYVVRIDEPRAAQLYAAIRSDSALPGAEPAPTSSPTLTVAAGGIRVRVLNGTGDRGLAARVARDLRAAGFDVVATGDADATGYAHTIVRYGPDRTESSQTLQAAVPGAERQLDGSLDRTLELVVGADYTGAHSVAVRGGGAGPGSQKPIPTTNAASDPCSSG